MDGSYSAIKGNSRSVLFITELVLAILIFALCMGICGSVFARAFDATFKSTNLNNAVIQARNAAELFHSQDSAEALARGLDGHFSGNEAVVVYYDVKWNVTQDPSLWAFVMRIDISEEGPLETAVINVNADIKREKGIYQLTSVKNNSLRRAG